MNIRKIPVVLALFFTLPSLAQEIGGKNMVKLNLSAFVVKGFNLQYERQLSRKFTAALGYSNIPMSTLAFKGYIQDQVNNADIDVSQFRLGTSVFTPEIRYYFSRKGAFNGFYLAAYARISKYKLQGPVNYTTSLDVERSILFDGKLNSFTGGLMAGCSFKLSQKFYLDWWIVGAGIGSANGNFSGNTPLTPTEQMSLKQELDDLDIPFTETQSQVNSNGATVTTTGSMVGLRGLGINLGFRF